MIPYGKQHITEEDITAVVDILRSDYLTQGPAIPSFEKAFAEYVGAEYAVACSNGTAALHLCTMALGVTAGQKVITTPITFAASANCIRYCGGEVVFADIDPATYTLDIENVKHLLQSSPKGSFAGIIPVDFTGYPVDLEKFRKLADEHNLWIIEDACHAPGAHFLDGNGIEQMSGNGTYADLSIFSFHPVKHIAAGEGGMVTTNNKELYNKLIQLRTHGITKDAEQLQENHGGWYYEMQALGYNYRLTDFQAALGESQLKRAEEGLQKRQKIAARYDQAFSELNIVHQQRTPNKYNAYHLYVIEVEDRLGLYNYLKEKGVFTQVHYVPVHLMPYYRDLGWRKGDFPHAETYYSRCLSLPMYPTLKEEEQEKVIQHIHEYIKSLN
jgi:UDP-4-amino-4,6-dideoxy-N-acetyl-beta-L-altrosamine transaminase